MPAAPFAGTASASKPIRTRPIERRPLLLLLRHPYLDAPPPQADHEPLPGSLGSRVAEYGGSRIGRVATEEEVG